ncbi:hypothetical protein PYCCODRAFT_1413905 [Trametes coccinea BRFM310]|uniref:Fungal-type protein kinase domain-containing protein n=1 Tax=Trametes coccinea (strain BRFM310) TaxID=1353009 RepID=A0A1Y2IHY5_TRAC3|nr:hypothetical protein PYCCODRAFT_1413905 [Trametes coccinea BRFM310]
MMPDILEGPVAGWLQCYTSNCVSQGQVDQIILYLKNEGLVLDHEGTVRWRDLADQLTSLCQPKRAYQQSTGEGDGSETQDTANNSTAMNELAIFERLGTVINAIVKVPLSNLLPSCRYEAEPHTTAYDETSESQHHLAGALRLIVSPSPNAPRCSTAATSDIAVSFAFKSENESDDAINDNRWKTLCSAAHALHSDCRRKHTYSITIENNRMSLWYFSRSHLAKSQEFDLLDVRAVVHALSALIFSNVEDLGYDANIRRISEWDEDAKEDHIRYIYRLDHRFLKTLKCRSEYDNLCIVGRATRVWEVIEVTSFDDIAPLPHAQRMILRDVWLGHDSETEREIQEMIFERCDELGRNFPPANDARLYGVDDATRTLLRERLRDGSYKQLFLTIEADHRGARSKPPAEGFTPVHAICGESVYCSQAAIGHASCMERASTSVAPSAADASATVKPQASVPREYKPRQRNCVVYREVCSALHELDDLYDVVQALLDALLALQILFLVSWIHRDVSSGNILSFEGRGKLSDLEYAKEFNLSIGGRSSDRRTGTPIFMAWEVHSRTTIFKERIYVVDMAAYEAEETPEPSLLVDSTLHNFQHDLESIWWILTWLVFTHIPGQDCAEAIVEMFHSRSSRFGIARNDLLTDHKRCQERLESLRQDLPPVIRAGLLTMRVALHNGYLERGTSIGDMSSYSPIYGQFRNILETIAAAVPRSSIRLVPPRR